MSEESSRECVILGASYGKRNRRESGHRANCKRTRIGSPSSIEISDDDFDDAGKDQAGTGALSVLKTVDLEARFSDDLTQSDSMERDNEGKALELTDDESLSELQLESKEEAHEPEIQEVSSRLLHLYGIKSTWKNMKFERSTYLLKTEPTNEKDAYALALKVRRKFMEQYHIPPVLFMDELERRVNAHLPICDSILKGEVPSLYYTMAKDLPKQSKREVITNEDLRNLDIVKFTAGYFGLRRQAIVGMLILEAYGNKLKRNKNPVVSFWGPSDFSQYVLAPELLCYLCMEDCKLQSVEEAWDILQATVDFGTKVADLDPLEIYEIELEEVALKKLNLGEEHSSMSYREDPRQHKGPLPLLEKNS